MQDNNISNWGEGLTFVQFMKYRGYHPGIKRAPYAAMFGTDPKFGISKHSLYVDMVEPMNGEEKLKMLCRQ
jgi:hypothetical protein